MVGAGKSARSAASRVFESIVCREVHQGLCVQYREARVAHQKGRPGERARVDHLEHDGCCGKVTKGEVERECAPKVAPPSAQTGDVVWRSHDNKPPIQGQGRRIPECSECRWRWGEWTYMKAPPSKWTMEHIVSSYRCRCRCQCGFMDRGNSWKILSP